MNQFEHPAQEAITRWISGDLSDALSEDFEAHIMSCEVCSARLQDEAALDVVLHAAGELALEDLGDDEDVVVLAPEPAAAAANGGGWRQVLAMAAGFALLLVAGRGALHGSSVDRVETDAAIAAEAAASWDGDDEDLDIDPVCDEAPVDDGEMCEEAELVAMAMPTESAPWSAMREPVGLPDEDPCTPVDTGESLTCDDWLSADDLAG